MKNTIFAAMVSLVLIVGMLANSDAETTGTTTQKQATVKAVEPKAASEAKVADPPKMPSGELAVKKDRSVRSEAVPPEEKRMEVAVEKKMAPDTMLKKQDEPQIADKLIKKHQAAIDLNNLLSKQLEINLKMQNLLRDQAEINLQIQKLLSKQKGDLKDDAKMGNFEIQDLMSKYNQAEQTQSNIAKKMHDAAMSAIRNMK